MPPYSSGTYDFVSGTTNIFFMLGYLSIVNPISTKILSHHGMILHRNMHIN
jgi:hypothetical protein